MARDRAHEQLVPPPRRRAQTLTGANVEEKFCAGGVGHRRWPFGLSCRLLSDRLAYLKRISRRAIG